MAARDSRLFKLLFEPQGAIEQFYKNPQRPYVVIRGSYFGKKPILRLLRFLLPQYRAYKEDDVLVRQLFLNKDKDVNLRQLTINPTPILSDSTHDELDGINKLPQEQREEAQNSWMEKLERPGKEETRAGGGGGGKPLVVEKAEEIVRAVPQETAQVESVEQQGLEVPEKEKVTPGRWNIPKFGRVAKEVESKLARGAITRVAAGRTGALLAARAALGAAGGPIGIVASTLGPGILKLGGKALGGAAVRTAAAAAIAGGWSLATIVIISFLIAILASFAIPFLFSSDNIIESAALLPLGGTTGGGGGGGDMSQCKFTRAGVSKPIKSSKLISIFQEVSAKSGVPASVLATVAVHENSDFPWNATDSHDAFSGIGFSGVECLPHFITSSTGALGLMQVQPPPRILPRARPDAFSVDGLTRGAAMLGKTFDSLTMQDFCSVRGSVYLGAGVLIAKNGGKPPTTGEEVKNAVCGYFGSPCTYQGSFHYGEEAKSDFENCKPTGGGTASCPIPNGKIICASYGPKMPWSGFNGDCAPASRSSTGEIDIGGHCSPKYRDKFPNLCSEPGTPKAYISGGNLKRTAKSIDVGGGPGTPIFIPTINGQQLKWHFIDDVNDDVGSTLRVFQSEQTSQGKWTIHFVHTSPDPSFSRNQLVDTSKPVAKITTGGDHVHVTVGLRITEPIIADNLRVYDPGWKFPDRDLGMCR